MQTKENGAVRQVDTKFSQIMKEHKLVYILKIYYLLCYMYMYYLRKSISCLCVSFIGERLVSSSMDGVSKVWDTSSKQVLLSINHKGNEE